MGFIFTRYLFQVIMEWFPPVPPMRRMWGYLRMALCVNAVSVYGGRFGFRFRFGLTSFGVGPAQEIQLNSKQNFWICKHNFWIPINKFLITFILLAIQHFLIAVWKVLLSNSV